MTLTTRNQATGLRHGTIRWPDGQPPTPSGCRWCGIEQRRHGIQGLPGHWNHQWEPPTTKQMWLRMEARRYHAVIAKRQRQREMRDGVNQLWDMILGGRVESRPIEPNDVED